MIVPVILSGGSGSRLWPLSREAFPKQFIDLVGEESLFSQTITRLETYSEPIAPPIIIANSEHRFIVASELQKSNLLNGSSILLEPFQRNTAPAICLATLRAKQLYGESAVLLILPADHIIADKHGFIESIKLGKKLSEDGLGVTFGIKPTAPHTGYGYIKIQKNMNHSDWFKSVKFVEKPDLKTAKSYFESSEYFWNSGIFMFRIDTLLAELATHEPSILEYTKQSLSGAKEDLDFIRIDSDSFAKCPSISLDYAVMEKTTSTVVVPLNSTWSDVGSWNSLLESSQKDEQGNYQKGDVILEDVKNSLIFSDSRLVVGLGISDQIVIETPDAVLVADRNSSEQVKKVVEKLRELGRSEYQLHRKAYRPWGSYEVMVLENRFQVKRIIVKPGEKLSLQKHHHRAEHWVVVRGTALIRKGEFEELLGEDSSTYIPLGTVHQLSNPGKIDLELIEVQTGSYLGEDDIVRYSDIYGRETATSN
jgi:mannose-1-phosphate guanylyltransferase / mannose-6-phosphate isomerase